MEAQAMFLYRRKSHGYYYLQYRDETGKTRYISTRQKKKSDALKFLREFKEKEQDKKQKLRSITVSEFIKEYFDYSKTIHTINSQESARAALNEFERIVGDIPLLKVGIKEVEYFIAVKKTERTLHTARRCFVTVSAAFKKACDWGYLRHNPFSKVAKPKLPEVLPLFFNKDEFKQLLEVIENEEFRDLCIVAVLTGMRFGELANLQWEHVDLINRRIYVQNTDEFTTKSKRNRIIPMNPVLSRLMAIRKESAVCQYVFHNQMNNLEKDSVSRKFKKYVIDAELNNKLHFHSLRHTCASWLVQSSVSLYEVQRILGHSSISVTEKYAHLQPSQLSDAMNRLELSYEIASLPQNGT
jgi:integrase/recombinase XerC